MKNKKQILNHLLNVGYSRNAMAKICGYMVAKDMKGVNDCVSIKIGDNTFADFIDWVNTKQVSFDDIKVGDYLSHALVGGFIVLEKCGHNNIIALCLDAQLNNICFSDETGDMLRRCTPEEVALLDDMINDHGLEDFIKKLYSCNG